MKKIKKFEKCTLQNHESQTGSDVIQQLSECVQFNFCVFLRKFAPKKVSIELKCLRTSNLTMYLLKVSQLESLHQLQVKFAFFS